MIINKFGAEGARRPGGDGATRPVGPARGEGGDRAPERFQPHEYAEAIVENGYNVARLCEMIANVRTRDDPRFTTFLTAVGMTKPGHIHRFYSYMKRRAHEKAVARWVRLGEKLSVMM